jgi:gluconate 5-dehydrogenase
MSYLDAIFSLTGKVALVTGSNRGIGYSLARGLALAGASVVLNGRDRERRDAAARNKKDEGIAASTSIVDVTDREAVVREVSRIEEQYGAIDVLVNNAGIQHRAPFVEFPAEKFVAIMRSNIYAPFFVAQAVARGMFRTDLNEALTKNPAFSDWLVNRTPLGRWGETKELVGAAIFLASDASSFVTGQIIYVDGGITSAV